RRLVAAELRAERVVSRHGAQARRAVVVGRALLTEPALLAHAHAFVAVGVAAHEARRAALGARARAVHRPVVDRAQAARAVAVRAARRVEAPAIGRAHRQVAGGRAREA